MKTEKFELAILIVIITLAGIIKLGTSLLPTSYVIPSSGSIGLPVTGPLHVDGKYIKDDLGQIVVLRGVNHPGFCGSCTGAWTTVGEMSGTGHWNWDEDTVRAHLQAIKNWGCNTVRMHFTMSWWIDDMSTVASRHPESVTDRSFRPCFTDTIRIADEMGLYVIIDPFTVYPGEQEMMPYPPANKPESREYINSVQDFVDFWEAIARDLGHYDNLIFELFNEPNCKIDGSPDSPMAIWFDACQRCIDAIRAIPCETPIIIQIGFCDDICWAPGGDIPDWMPFYPLNGTNIIYSMHMYRAGNPASPYLYDDVKQYYFTDRCYEEVVETVPVFVGEVGCFYNPGIGVAPDPNEIIWWQNVLKIFDELGISFTAWVWGETSWSGFSLQKHEPAVQSPNESGQLLIEAIANATS